MSLDGDIVAFELKGDLEHGRRFLNGLQMLSRTNQQFERQPKHRFAPRLHKRFQTQ